MSAAAAIPAAAGLSIGIPAPGTVLGKHCACGRSASWPVASFPDILAAQCQAEEAGWGYDAHGNCRCPACKAQDAAETEVQP